MNSLRSRVSFVVLFFAGVAAGDTAARGCPICGQPTVTLSERYARADAALLVEWVSARPARDGQPDSTTYEIVEVSRGGTGTWKKGDRLTVEGFHSGKSGSLVFLLGNKTAAGPIKWDHPPLDVTETGFQYIVQAPGPEAPRVKRLEYFVRFLEFPDVTIANDAFGEFANAPADDIFAVAGKLPREKLRRWLLDEKTPPGRQAGYGLMLGLCGKEADAPLLRERILDDSGERRIGIEGLIVGYLLLTGEEGLQLLEKARLKAVSQEAGEIFPVQVALRYFWTYGKGRIPRTRLEEAMRMLVDHPTFAESAITDLARWKDWGIQKRLAELYGTKGYDDERTKTAIIGFMIASTKDVPKDAEAPLPPHAVAGTEILRKFRVRDPALVARAEKFFLLK
jgi:hypothetical protein